MLLSQSARVWLALSCLFALSSASLAFTTIKGTAPGLRPLKASAVSRQSLKLCMSASSKNKKKTSGHQLISKWLKSEVPPPPLITPVVDIHSEAEGEDTMDRTEATLHKMERILRNAQDHICAAVEAVDGGAAFKEDDHTRENTAGSHLAVIDGTLQTMEQARLDGGGGRTRVLANGNVFEKAGIALSVVYGEMPGEALAVTPDRKKHGTGNKRREGYKKGEKVPFASAGLSAVLHPKNPFCPTVHFNYRYFETESGHWWFGGGSDITPCYLDEEDMVHFHGTYKEVCDKYDAGYYARFKAWADDYFRIPHRAETRGLGGIFFDDLNDKPADTLLGFVEECVMALPEAYLPLVRKHREDPFTQENKRWQQIRRGRYVEFNLVCDRGVLFGLQTGLGRMESILMSLPETTRWEYDAAPEEGTPEAEISKLFAEPRDFV